MSRLLEPINLKKLAKEGTKFQIDASFVKDHDSSSDEEDTSAADYEQKLHQLSNNQCCGMFDEDIYEEGEPFEIIAKRMFNLVPDGKIKKRIIRHGDGEKPQEYAIVKIHYNGYVEFDEQPFDSSYAREKPIKFTIGKGGVIPGLDFAVQSMKLNEKSQFLFHPDYAYGKSILIGRIPTNATVLFEVELLEVVNSGAAIAYENLTDDQKTLFPEVYKYCTALCERGKWAFKDNNLKNAIKDYNTARCKLEKVMLNSPKEVEQHRELALRLYSNLLICYTRIREPRKGCANAKKIYDLTHNGELANISAKMYFNHAKCLRFLGEYEDAKITLDKAYKMEPKNPEIVNEMLNLENDKLKHKKNQAVLAKALFESTD